MTPDERADVLAAVAVELVGRVRDDEPAAFHRWLRHALVDAGFTAPDDDSLAMMTVLACAVPDDRPWTHLTAWTLMRKDLRTERFGPIPWRERYAKPTPLSTKPVESLGTVPIHRLSRGLSTSELDSAEERGAA